MEHMGTEGALNPFFSRDGLRVGFTSGAAGSAEIKVASLAGGPPTTVTSTGVGGPGVDSMPVSLVKSKFTERNPSLSPDGRWLLYEANTTGRMEAYVRPFPNSSPGLYQISSGGGSGAKWSRDGREIFFANGNAELVRVAVVPGNSFAIADQRVLFSLRGVADWDVAPEGRRFIRIRDRQGQQHRKLVVVENFFQELKARVPR